MPFPLQAEPPVVLAAIEAATEDAGFKLASDRRTGALLRALAASKRGGRFLELGTGTGVATAWLLDGMDAGSELISVDENESFQAIARDHLGRDPRFELLREDAGAFIERWPQASFDLIFADTWAGKFTHLDPTLRLLRPGGLYVVDDLFPQPDWPPEHGPKVDAFLASLAARQGLRLTALDWGTGHIVAAIR